MEIRQYLIDKGFEFKERNRPSGVNAIMVCPFCSGGEKHEKTFAINLNTGAWNCLRLNNCGLSGSFYELKSKLGDKPVRLQTSMPKKRISYQKPAPTSSPLSLKNSEYLKWRGFTEKTINDFKLFSSKNGEIGMPFHKNKVVVNVKYRTIDKKFRQEKNAEPCLFNRDNASGTTLTVTEGEMDCMALHQYGFKSVVSLPSGTNDHRWIDNEWDFLEQFETIYLCMDNDTAGHVATSALVVRLGKWRCRGITFSHKDAADCLKAKISKEVMQQCFDNAIDYPPAALKDATEFDEEVIGLFLDPDKNRGMKTGLPGLDHYIGGWRPGEVTIWTGQSGSGKTTILIQICLFLTQNKTNTCIASLELRPAKYLFWAVCQALGRKFPKTEEIRNVFEWLYRKMWVLDTTDAVSPDQLFEVFEYAARRHGVEHFVIDSLMTIKLPGTDEYAAQKEFIVRLTTFAKKHNAHVHLVAHPRKTASDRDRAGRVDVKGSGDITNLADNVLSMWRPEYEKGEQGQGDPDTVLFVQKNRWQGETGGVMLFFNAIAKRFSCQDQTINFGI